MLRNLGFAAIVAMIAILCSQQVVAQSGYGKNQNITASATVYQPLTIGSVSNFNFGNIKLGYNPIVNPQTGVASNILSNSSVGGMVVNGSAAAKVIFSWGAGQVDLTSGANTMKYTPDVYGGDAGAQGSSVQLTSGSTAVTLTGGSCQVWVGGELFDGVTGAAVVPTTQATGTYSGTLNLAVDYYQ
jgi:hypothetical protein